MFGIEHYSSFLLAILVFQLIPGPGTIAILNATARHGISVGFAAVCGTLLGDCVYMLAAVVGLATIMKSYPILFQVLQWFGIAYLCWMGVQLLRTKITPDASNETPKLSSWTYLRQAFLVSLTNPKVMLFFVAFFPLFLSPTASSATLIAMMIHVTLISLLYQAGLVLLGNAVAQRLRALPSARLWATRLAGIALIGFGVKLALNNR